MANDGFHSIPRLFLLGDFPSPLEVQICSRFVPVGISANSESDVSNRGHVLDLVRLLLLMI